MVISYTTSVFGIEMICFDEKFDLIFDLFVCYSLCLFYSVINFNGLYVVLDLIFDLFVRP